MSEDSRPELPADDELPGQPGVTLQQYKDLMVRRPCCRQVDSVLGTPTRAGAQAGLILDLNVVTHPVLQMPS